MSLSVLFSGTFTNDAGGGNGEAVTVDVTISYAGGSVQFPGVPGQIPTPPSGPLADGYDAILVYPSQACMWTISDESPAGFTVTLTPSSGVTLAAGTIDVVVI
jgi:hypothetical protein